ncbi:astacin-like metalloprotease toxin 5 [Parasteatoda tepidariorum]|uniref:astacin-like metalloprotease toxin 5 n=1 Tax=Parasteatoda tepidariorum TaxID=114398 RepID=UPI001C72288E|nr:astacin-like metalloprotease toxin 5 [Parasteatoda tepidariorum]
MISKMYGIIIVSVFTLASGLKEFYNPLINEGLFEGDILGIHSNKDRNAVPRDSQLWPGAVVPYVISPELEYLREEIRNAMKHIEDHSCINFVERSYEHDYVKIFRHTGCYSNWGRIGRENQLSLGYGCENFGIIVHELMHAIGFEHEHNRSDRDEYLTINWENIQPDWYYAFRKLHPEENRLLTEFDFSSIMLYGSKSFAKEWTHSMVAKDGRTLPEVHEKTSMSVLDSRRIKMLYNCRL